MLASGTKLGTYEVTSHIGSGGMGEVYQAHDTKLGRDVAIKVLPEQFARDPERLARFQREAKLLAALNHPNIATIHGLEQSGNTHYLVMELVPGETLRDRIAREGPVPVEEALTIAKQIAEALEAAHNSEKAIIHRDLKPANVKVTPEGRVKVLDFGLAKAFAADTTSDDPSNSPTLSMNPTQQGVIMGTAAYMSPEQARGKAVTKATDIFAFGAVLYELLTGKQAFQGEDVSDILAAVIRAEPDWSRLPADTPPNIRTLLKRCLRKDKRQRLGDAGAARIEVEDVLSGAVTSEPAMAATPIGRWAFPGRMAWTIAAAALFLGAVIAGMTAWTFKPTPFVARPISRFHYDLPPGHVFRNVQRPVMALAPDGSRFVYNTTQGLFLRSMDQLEARLIPGTEAVLTTPFFSPDGQWVGYFQGNQLRKIAIGGGAPIPIGPAQANFGASWGLDDTILFAQTDGILLVSANGGTPELIIKSEAGEQFSGPQFLPGGEWILFSVGGGAGTWDEARIVIQSLRTKERRDVWRGGSDARYVPTGHIVYAFDDDLFAVPFDLDTLSVTGGPVSLVENVSRAAATGVGAYGISDSGSLVYVVGTALSARSLVWVDRAGKEEAITVSPRGYVFPRISPDGTRVAVDVRDQESDILIWDFRRQTLTRFTPTAESEAYPIWTPNGERLAYRSGRAIQWKPADGSGVAERITEKVLQPALYFFSPTGKELVFRGQGEGRGGVDIGMVSVGNDAQVVPVGGSTGDPVWLLQGQYAETNAELSPDGRWMAYQSNESGNAEIYVRPFPNVTEGHQQVSGAGGAQPLWSRNGRELFYLQPGPPVRLMAVPVRTGTAFDRDNPQALFDWPYLVGNSGRTYDVSVDGRRFLALKALVAATEGDAPRPRIIVVQNWTEELKRRVPTGTR
jgi:serine/threonine-protein kinase